MSTKEHLDKLNAIDTSNKLPDEPTVVKISFGSQQITQFVVDDDTYCDVKGIAIKSPDKKPELREVSDSQGKEPLVSNIANAGQTDAKVTLPTNNPSDETLRGKRNEIWTNFFD